MSGIKLPGELKRIAPYCLLTVVLVNENIGNRIQAYASDLTLWLGRHREMTYWN